MFTIFQTIILIAITISEIRAVPLPGKSSPLKTSIVEVKVISRRKRSLDNLESGYNLEVKAFEKTHKLQLRSPTDSIFSDAFTYQEFDTDELGNTVQNEKSISKRDLQAIEENIYVDSEAQAVLRVRDAEGEFHLEGILDKIRLRRDSNNKSQTVATDEPSQTKSRHDYVDYNRPVATPRGISTGKIAVTVELLIKFDYESSKLFNFDAKKIIDYLGVMVNAVNNRFATLDDPKITFKICGILTAKTTANQPYLEKNKVNKNGTRVDVLPVLTDFSAWVTSKLKTLPKHDIAALLIGYNVIEASGVAPLSGACDFGTRGWGGMTRAVIVAHDGNRFETPATHGASWAGMEPLTHELGHNLGCYHDGDGKSKDCPWEQGYIMSYIGYGKPNKFTFSPCSARSMKEFIQSTGGDCLWRKDNPKKPIAVNGNIGERMNLLQMCKKRTGFQNATLPKKRTPDEQCLQLFCGMGYAKTANTQAMEWDQEFYEIGGDNTPCGSGGKCQNGKCIG